MLFKVLMSLLILIVITAVGVIIFDSNRFVVRKYSISSDKIDSDVRIIFLSDLHNKSYGKNNDRLLKCIEGLKGDMILAGGDMMTASGHSGYDRAVSFLKEVSCYAPLYYTYGNHESRARENRKNRYGTLFADYKKALDKAGIVLHDNDAVKLTGVNIIGITVPEKFYYKKKPETMTCEDVSKCIGTPDDSALNILLAHNPEYFDAYSKWGADVVLSGHYHGGVVRFPFWGKGIISPRFKLFPKYDGGKYVTGASTMIVSRGLGMHTIPLRMFNPAEIVVLDIKRT